jgi:putative tryptophan/tyrosine transport system substrate-binding protein
MLPSHPNAQQAALPILGVLDSSTATALKSSAFYEGLKLEGFSRNQNLTVEYHSAEGDYARLPNLAADLVNRRVNLITALGSPAALAAKARPRASRLSLRSMRTRSRSDLSPASTWGK